VHSKFSSVTNQNESCVSDDLWLYKHYTRSSLDCSAKVSMHVIKSWFFRFLDLGQPVVVDAAGFGRLAVAVLDALESDSVCSSVEVSTETPLLAEMMHGGWIDGSRSKMGRRACLNSHVHLPRPVSLLASVTFLNLKSNRTSEKCHLWVL